MNQVKQWFNELAPRERQMVSAALVVIILFVIYQTWTSFVSHVDKLQHRVDNQQTILTWMQQAANEVKQLRGSAGTSNRPKGKQLLLGLIDRSAKQNQLGGSLQKVQPEGEQGVRIWLEKAPFKSIIIWLDNLQYQHGLVVTDISLESQDVTGTVSARVLIESL